MSLASGSRLGPYEIVAPLGAGGMGEVYRARDTRLRREVAIKALPDAFVHDADRMSRFEREAQVLASLNHPNIAAIHGLEEVGGASCLVLELVEGSTLADKLKGGPLPVEEALEIARQIAEALEAAHERGVVHRDLKPANVKVTPDGTVKVLDFGLAKALEGGPVVSDMANSPTLSVAATGAGVILGTAAYMSPEQGRGKPLDRRADIWAFGCVLFEMLTGKRAFEGETVSDTLASVLKTEPEWGALPASTPASARRLLRRCLEKDLRSRLQAIGEARITLEETLSGTPEAGTTVGVSGVQQPLWKRFLPWGLLGVVVVALMLMLIRLRQVTQPNPQTVKRLALTLPANQQLALAELPAVALSLDGKRLVYVARQGASTQLYLRLMDRFEATPLQGTEGATDPFLSPDGQWVGFFAEGRLKRVSVQGGAPMTLCEATTDRGASWGTDDTIVFSPEATSGLMRIPASGGLPQVLTVPDKEKGERTHRWPEILPGGKAVLFTIGTLNSPGYYDDARIGVLSLETGQRQILIEGASLARYAATGHLIYARAGALMAAPFDLGRLRVTGPAIPVLQGVAVDTTTGAAHFSVSDDGSLVYVPSSAESGRLNLVWVDRSGNVRPLPAPPRAYMHPRVSPDGERVAVGIGPGPGNGNDIWVYDLARNSLTRLTFDEAASRPAWTPDGKRVTFSSEKGGTEGMYWRAADGSTPAEAISRSPDPQFPEFWSTDGQLLAFTQLSQSTRADIWLLPLKGDRKPRPFLRTGANEFSPSFSPDGHWLAYASDESGLEAVYVQPFPGPGGKWQVSTETGGDNPVWARSGRELFYRSGEKIMVVPVQTRPGFAAGTPRMLFQGVFADANAPTSDYDVSPDGQRFLMIKSVEPESASTRINVVVHWFDEVRRVVPAGRK
jgi:eukaryotic-like serine/threonine-protein kinase